MKTSRVVVSLFAAAVATVSFANVAKNQVAYVPPSLVDHPVFSWPIWKTIKLGTSGLRTADDFRQAIKTNGCFIGPCANSIIEKPQFSPTPKEAELDLVMISVAELGFGDGATCVQIYMRAKELGLQLCPSDVAPQLRLQYTNQPNGEWLVIGTEPVNNGKSIGLFYVGRDSKGLFWLGGCYGSPGFVWDSSYTWIFVRPPDSAKDASSVLGKAGR